MVRDSVFRTVDDRSPRPCSCSLPLPAEAQWKWNDKGGHIQYSDLPPPAGTPDQDILSRPTARAAPARRAGRLRAASAPHRRRRPPPALSAEGRSIRSSRPSARRRKAKSPPRTRPRKTASPRPRPTTAPAPRRSCARFESGIAHRAHQRQGRARVPRRQAARRRDQARQGRDRRRLPEVAARQRFAASGAAARTPPRLLRIHQQRPVDLDPVAVGERRIERRASGPRCPPPGSRCRPHRRSTSAAGADRVEHVAPAGSSTSTSQASPGRADQATATCSTGAPLARAIDLLGAADEGIDEGVGDPVEHRADRGLEQRRWRRRSAGRTRSCRRSPCAGRRGAGSGSGTKRQRPSSSENGPSTSVDLHRLVRRPGRCGW